MAEPPAADDQIIMCRSVEEIASYLLEKIPSEAWKKGQPTPFDDAAELANSVKIILDRYGNHGERLEVFFMALVKMELLEATVKELVNFLQGPNADVGRGERQMVGISHKVLETSLTHNFDVNALKDRINHIFQTFYDNQNKDELYAPYLCFVQSSGMGKTKIIHELCQSYARTCNQEITVCGRRMVMKAT